MAAKRLYPWERWLSQPVTKLVRGVDYTCSQSIMWQIIRNNAYRRGVRFKLTDTHDGMLIEVLPDEREGLAGDGDTVGPSAGLEALPHP